MIMLIVTVSTYPFSIKIGDNGNVFIALSSEGDGIAIGYGVVEASFIRMVNGLVVSVV